MAMKQLTNAAIAAIAVFFIGLVLDKSDFGGDRCIFD